MGGGGKGLFTSEAKGCDFHVRDGEQIICYYVPLPQMFQGLRFDH